MDFISSSKWFSAVPLVALTMLLIGWNLRQSAVIAKKNVYVNDTLHFEFEYGKDWVADSIKPISGKFYFLSKPDVKLRLHILPSYAYDYKVIHERYNKTAFRNFTKTSGNSIKIGLKDAYKLSFTYLKEDTDNEKKIYVTQVLIPVKNDIILFSFSASEADYPVYEPYFLQMLTTLRFW
jgi:hypothetical protein